VHRLTKKQQEYDARYEMEVDAAIGDYLDNWKQISPETRGLLHEELRSALELKVRYKVRPLSRVKGAA
jgi:hypothetical protein